MRLISPALVAVFAATALAALPAQAAPLSTVLPDAAGGYETRTAAVVPDAAGGYEKAAAADARVPGIKRLPPRSPRTVPVLGAPQAGVAPETTHDGGLPWVIVALGLAGGTIGLVAATIHADARRRTARPRAVA